MGKFWKGLSYQRASRASGAGDLCKRLQGEEKMKRSEMLSFNLYPLKIFVGGFTGFLSVFVEELMPLFFTVLFFEVVDFVTGLIKSAVVSKRKGEHFAFESIKAWRTIYKLIFLILGIVLCEMLDRALSLESRFRFANYFTVFCCGIELWSFLENAAVISDHPIFRALRKVMRVKIEEQIGLTGMDDDKG